MKRQIPLLLILLFIAQGCSLLKLETGDTPLPQKDINARATIRSFYNDYCANIIATSDSIISVSDDPQMKLIAIKWKINATSLCADAAYNSMPEIAILNTWFLCYNLDNYISKYGNEYFKEYTPLVKSSTQTNLKNIKTIAKNYLSVDRYMKMESFVQTFKMDYNKDVNIDLYLPWLRYIDVPDSTYITTTGSIAQTIENLDSKVNGMSTQWGYNIAWSKDFFLTEMSRDSTKAEINSRLDSLLSDFNRISRTLENSPELLASITNDLNKNVTEIIETMNRSVDNAFVDIDNQRRELQTFIDSQRVSIMAQADSTASHAVNTALDAIPSMIGKVLLWVILFTVVLFSIPFGIGYFIGNVMGKKKAKKTPEK
ncbi:MAG: hypothetical protein PHD21_01950 [Flavobacteriales bacterium]|nr:hypothetical protein [Flavobacteriales bacterium]